jgi:hypothetical protein
MGIIKYAFVKVSLIEFQLILLKLFKGYMEDSELLGFWTLFIVRYSNNTREHNVSETGSVSVLG